jgi:hypothetical protein
MSATNGVAVAAPRILASTFSSRLASLYAGKYSLVSGVFRLVTRLSASYAVAVVNTSDSRLAVAAVSIAAIVDAEAIAFQLNVGV